MRHNRRLIDTIKQQFARKSSAQIQEIVRADDPKRWSGEALAAAQEILQDRASGRAQEPLVGEEERLPPCSSEAAIDNILVDIALGLVGGFNPFQFARPPRIHWADDHIARDQPIPFGSRIAWLALCTTDTAGVAAALHLQGMREATWVEGLDAAHQSSLFVTPPLGEWTLAVGAALFPPDPPEPFVKPILEGLSREFGEAQYFCTHRDLEWHVWASAREGQLVRGYGWLGERARTLWDEGRPTRAERQVGLQFEPGQGPRVANQPNATPTPLKERCVMRLAALWSIDPSALDEQLKEPVLGLLGEPAVGAV